LQLSPLRFRVFRVFHGDPSASVRLSRFFKPVIARAETNAEPPGDRAMNYFRDCHREERSDVAIQLIDCSRGLPQSPRLLRNDKQGEFIYSSGIERQRSNQAGYPGREAPRYAKPG
jgi:hypothetical protein